MSSLERRRDTFDEVAEEYDRFRPGYPAALFDDVVRLSGIPARGHILEIGCGTGKATVPLAARGYRITALEPGANLARVARRNLAPYPDVRIEASRFEDWDAPAGAYELVVAAQSFHFIATRTGLARAATLLRPGGAVAIFAYQPQRGDSPAHRRVQEAYARHAPDLRPRDEGTALEHDIDDTGSFETVSMAGYGWQTTYTADEYRGLMSTQSDHRLLPPAEREALLAAIGRAIDECGGAIAIDFVAHLHVARRRTPA